MFSQYSWGDFIKVVILLAIPYYAFVAWKYYREDIRDWFSQKGEKDQKASDVPAEEDEEEVDESGLYSVKTYSTTTVTPATAAPVQQIDATEAAETVSAPEAVEEPQSVAAVDVEISDGVVVNESATETFELGLPSAPIRPAERSLAEVINASRRMKVEDNGEHTPYDPKDVEASDLANTLNQQKGIGSLLAGLSFTR